MVYPDRLFHNVGASKTDELYVAQKALIVGFSRVGRDVSTSDERRPTIDFMS